jgi:hypothetical protein
VYDETLESLTAVDYEMWLSEYPTYEREKVERILIPSVGAYLGEVLVARLGGRWVPRRNLEETQVVVGDRAWLPFVRARRYLRTRQSVSTARSPSSPARPSATCAHCEAPERKRRVRSLRRGGIN